jgi:hypothetical protein
MNTIEHILGSIVAVSTTGYPGKVSTSLSTVPKSAEEFTVGEGLGLISGQWIYTSAHYQDTFAMLPGDADLFAAWCLNDPEVTRGIFAGYYASSLDFMILAPDGMTIEMTDGGTEDGLQMTGEVWDKHGAGIRPTEIDFAEGVGSTKISGYYIGADGKTMHRVKFKIWKHSADIDFYSDDFLIGGTGSPIFTDENQLIGVTTVASSHPDLNGLHHCLGKRIDQCMPKLLHHCVEWDHLMIQPQPEQAPDPDDPWVKQQAAWNKLEP